MFFDKIRKMREVSHNKGWFKMDKSQNREALSIKYDAVKVLKFLIPKSIYVLGGYFSALATLPFGAIPFGIALLASSGRDAVFVYIGLALSCLVSFEGTLSAMLLGIYTALLLIRSLVRLTLDYPFGKDKPKPSARQILGVMFSESLTYRILLSAVMAFALGACIAIGGGLLYYDIFGLILLSIVAPLATYIFSGFFCRRGIARELGFLAICSACVFGALPFKIYGVSLAVLGALLITFAVTEKKGMGYGAITGLALGLIYSPILSPLFVISAICIGIFIRISVSLACFSAFFTGAAWGFYIKGIYALDGLFAGILSACLIYAVWRRLFGGVRVAQSKRAPLCKVLGESEFDGIRLYDMNRRMSAISEGLSYLSSFFEEIKLRYPKQAELMQICEDALRSSCTGCPMSEGCRERGRIENEAGRLSALLRKNRGLSVLDFDRELVSRCSRLTDILDEINYNSGLRIYGLDKSFEQKDEVFAPDYKALSRLLEKSMEDESDEYTIDAELSKRLCSPLDELELNIEGVFVYGRRRRTVYIRARDIRKLEENREKIFDILRDKLPFAPSRDSMMVRRCSGEGGALSVSEGNTLSVSYVTRQTRAREESKFCGDSVTVFENKDNRFFSLVSDGMGSGREAAAVSEICARFMEGMLTVGGMNKELLSMLGGFLSGRCEGSLCECSATIDLMELDLISGKTSFYKSGAAPTYIYRNGNLFKLRSRTMPIGILQDTEAKRLDVTLSKGDVVVMLSDGVTGGEEESPWLFDLLRQNLEGSGLDRTAELIIKYAVGHGSEDDISAVVLKLCDAQEMTV